MLQNYEKYFQHLIHLCKFVPKGVPPCNHAPSKASDCHTVVSGLLGYPVNKTHGTEGGFFLACMVVPEKGNETVGVISSIKQLILLPLCRRPSPGFQRDQKGRRHWLYMSNVLLMLSDAKQQSDYTGTSINESRPAIIPSIIGYDARSDLFNLL